MIALISSQAFNAVQDVCFWSLLLISARLTIPQVLQDGKEVSPSSDVPINLRVVMRLTGRILAALSLDCTRLLDYAGARIGLLFECQMTPDIAHRSAIC
jgi:hypothetical protein